MTSALPINGFMNPTNTQPVLAEKTTGGGVVPSDKSKEWQMELMMEKLRSKASSFKTLVESAKNIRMAMLDKRFGIDSVEKSQLQKSLDALQHSIKVTSLQSMIERLESLSRQLGLKFMAGTAASTTSTEIYISSDMFFLEVLLEPSGAVKDVKIHHDGKSEQQSGEELVACLSRGDFVDFTTQLEGLASIYQLNADKKVKCKAFSALQSLETDLGILAQLQTFIKEPFNLVHKSPVGILERRKGGHAMKLTYFVTPFDLIDFENKTCEALSLEAVISKKVGHSVTVCMEGSTSHKLPISSIITLNRGPTGKSTPSYAPLTSANSSVLPACFVLKLTKKMPMCLELVRWIQKVTDLECTDISAPAPLLSMIVQHASDKQLDCKNNKGLPVCLPDQQHCYFMTENRTMEGVLVGSIPFTHPAHVPQILVYLRQQALFNSLISSCVRPMARLDPENATIFEVSALSWQCISVSLEHPFEETLATAELDLSDISAPKCKLYGVSINNAEQTSELAGKVLQRSLSIPVTMRTLIKTWEGKTFTLKPTNGGNNSFNNNNLGPGRDQNNHNGSNVPEFGNNDDIKIKQEPGLGMNGTAGSGRQQSQQNQQQQSFLEAGAENSIGFPSFSGSSDTPNAAMVNPLRLGATTPTMGDGKDKKSRKRKGADGSWKSPKRKSDLDSNEILLESSSSDSTPLGTPTSSKDATNDNRTPTPTSAASIASGGLDLSNPDPLEILSTDKSSDYDMDNEPEIVQIEPGTSLEDVFKRERKLKKREEKPSPTRMFDESKISVLPSVSITPIASGSLVPNTAYNSMLPNITFDRRPGIEIIPIPHQLSQANIPSSITITPIMNPKSSSSSPSSSASSSLGDDRKERKSSKNRSSSSVEDASKSKLEKKRKRKRDSSPMGPPDKLPLKQDSLAKPMSLSIKPTSESPPLTSPSSRPSSPSTTLRKFSPSPTRANPLVNVGKSSPTLKQSLNTSGSSSSSSGSSKPSPRHSPVYSSPKHMSSMPSSSASPKHGTSSPKHGSSGSAGKPSMSALKSATSSPSGKSDTSKKVPALSPSSTSPSSSAVNLTTALSASSSSSMSSNKESRDKERKTSSNVFGSGGSSSSSGGSSSGHQSPKSKSLAPKPKPVEAETHGSLTANPNQAGSTTPPLDANKSVAIQRNRKGSLSAIVDKLKNAQHCTDDAGSPTSNLTPTAPTAGAATTTTTSASPGNNKTPAGEVKNPEYMIKQSLDGMKLTINKTRTKEIKTNSGIKITPVPMTGSNLASSGGGVSPTGLNAGSSSPKTTYTGLKPGSNACPASRKPQAQASPKIRSTSPLTPSSSSSSKSGVSIQKVPTGSIKSLTGSSLGTSGPLLNKAKTFPPSSGLSIKHGSATADLARARDKARFKPGDKSFIGKSSDMRKSNPSLSESDGEKAFKLLAAHASMSNFSNSSGLPPQLMIQKQLDTKFQIPKLSARANADSGDKRSVDKVDSGSKPPSDLSNRPTMSSSPSISKMEEQHPALTFTPVPSTASSAFTTNATSIHDSNVPTNLSIQPDDKVEITKTFVTPVTEATTKEPDMSSSGESLNLTKSAEKYKVPDDKEQPFHRVPHIEKKLPEPTPANITLTLVPPPSSLAPGPSNPISQEAAEMLLDFSTPKEAGSGGGLPMKSAALSFAASLSPIRKNTTPPPPPPPLPPPLPPPSMTATALPPVPPSVSPITFSAIHPPSPSVSVLITKSPAPSPRVVPSPHSASPCITDDELMDEALVGS